jgi:hypothetical protein
MPDQESKIRLCSPHPVAQMVELVRSGLATATADRVVAGQVPARRSLRRVGALLIPRRP